MSLITCPECAKSVSSEAVACPACGHPIKPPPAPAKKTGFWWGLGCLLAVPAVMTVVAIIGLLAAIAIPSFMRARTTSQSNACINNLRQIEAAKRSYALEQGLTNGATVTFANIGPTATGGGYIKALPVCPAAAHADPITRTQSLTESDYDIGVIGQDPRCRIVPDKHVLQNFIRHYRGAIGPYLQKGERVQSEPDVIITKAIEPYRAKPYSELVKMVNAEPKTIDVKWSCSKAYQVAIWAMWENESNGNICVMGMVKAKEGEDIIIPHKRSFIKSPSNQFVGKPDKD